LQRHFGSTDDAFALEVIGGSMIDDGINSGDYVSANEFQPPATANWLWQLLMMTPRPSNAFIKSRRAPDLNLQIKITRLFIVQLPN